MNTFVKKAIKYLIFALPAVALVVGNGMYFPFITGKAFLFRIGVELAFFLYLALAISDKSYRPKWNALTIAFAAFVLMMLVADIFAVNPFKAFWSNFERMDGFVTLAHLFIYFVVASAVLKGSRDWKVWMLTQVTLSVYMLFFCFLQLVGEAKINQGGVRVDGSLGNAAYLAVYMMFHIFFLLYIWVSERVDFRAIGVSIAVGGIGYSIYYLLRIGQSAVSHTNAGLWILLAAIVVAVGSLILRSRAVGERLQRIAAHTSLTIILVSYLVVLYHTATRGAILGLIGGIYITGLYLVFKAKGDKHIRYASAVVLVTLSLLIGSFYSLRDSQFIKDSPVLSRFASLSLDTKGQARNYVWPMAIQGFKENPILGWGQEGFSYVFQKYYVPEMLTQEPWFDRAHNSFLDWLVAGGLLGAIPYVALYVIAAFYILRGSSFDDREKAVLLGLLSAYTFQSMLIFDNLMSYVFFVSLLAFVSSRYEEITAQGEKSPTSLDASVLGVCAISFLVVTFIVNVGGYRQNISLSEGISKPQVGGILQNLALIKKGIERSPMGRYESREQLTRVVFQVISAPNISDEDKYAFINATVEEMDKQITDNPEDARAHLVFGDFLVSFGQYDKALEVLEGARKLAPKKQQVLFALARLHISRAANSQDKNAAAYDTSKGLAVIKEAYELAPNIDQSRTPYISALLITGHVDEAVPIIKEVEDTTSLVDTELVKAMVSKGYANDAIKMLRKAIEVDPKNADAYTMIGDIYLFLNQPQNVIAILEEMAEAIPAKRTDVDKNIATVKAKFNLK